MSALADQITAALRVLIGEPIGDCWRAADMQIFEFGSRQWTKNRKGGDIELSDIRLHLQCRWRFVNGERILFGQDDLYRPADDGIPLREFDWDKQPSALDIEQRAWFDRSRETPPKVVAATGDQYGGFRIELTDGFVLESFPCDSNRGECSEHWRLLGPRDDDSHFVVTGYGVEPAGDL